MIQVNMPNPIGEEHWGFWIALYFFLAGVGGGAYLLSVLHASESLRRVRQAAMMAFLAEVLGSGLLVLDLGQPLRFLNLFLSGFYPSSVMWTGSWFLLLAGAALLWVFLRPASRAAQLSAALLVALVVSYTAVLLMATAKPFWNATPLLPWLFLASAATSGAALLQLLEPDERVKRVLVAMAFVELGVLLLHLLWAYPQAAASVMALLAGPLAWAFWGFLVLGWALPIWLERRTHLAAAVLTLFGAFLLRYFIVFAGQV